jgi:predicted small integral membrane protein
MGIMEIIGIAGSVSLLSGWRLYLCVFATGLAMRADLLPLPEHLASLGVLANPWVMGIAGIAALVEFFADKVMWLDSAWDAVHTFVRPVGGALLALAIVDPSDPATQVIAFLLGGGASFLAHGGKASARAVVNTSPEPVSNILASSAEDVVTVGLLWVAYEYPVVAGAIAAVLLVLAGALLWWARRVIKRVFFRRPKVQG